MPDKPDTLIEIGKLFAPALSSLVGGLIAISGGFLIQRINKAEKNRDLIRNKIEEIYQHTIDTEDWLKQETIKMNTFVANRSKLDLDALKTKSRHIKMLLRLYFEDSSEICEELGKFEKLFYESMQLAYSSPEELNKPEHKELISQASTIYFSGLVKIREFLQTKMKKLTRN